METINLIKVWWHCLWRMWSGHRMVKFTYDGGEVHWACDCGYCSDKSHWKHLNK